jgi:Ricin-type beta-trefoil lectin domain/Glycosyl hydrolases family 16
MTGLLCDARGAFHAVRAWSRPRGRRLAALAVAAGWTFALTTIAAPPAADAATAAPASVLAPASALAPAAGAAIAAPAAVPGPPSGWSTVFSDDFSGAAGSGIDSQWMYDTGPGANFGTGEIETMTNSTSNVHFDGNGNLDITALGSGSSWTSGRVQTTSANVGAPAGGELEVTASIQQPNGGPGYWPAFWMLGPGQWPENGEIDIMEDVNSLSEHSATLHCGTDPGGPCNEPTGVGSGLQACSGCQSAYHTYTMILNRTNTAAETATFYLDGNQDFTVNESQVGTATWQAAFDHNMSIIFDLAMGGAYPNAICGCTTPTGSTASGGTMSVAYVAAYTTGSGTPPPPPPPPPGSGPIVGYGGLCADVRGANTANYTPVQVYTCNNTNAQQWTVVQAGSTLHALGKCMDINGGGTADGTTVDLYDCNNTAAQVFIPQSNGSLYNPQSGKCLDDTNWSTTPGTQLQIWDCTGNANQHWSLP